MTRAELSDLRLGPASELSTLTRTIYQRATFRLILLLLKQPAGRVRSACHGLLNALFSGPGAVTRLLGALLSPACHDSSTKSADKEQCQCCLLSMLRCGRVRGSEGVVLGSVGNHLEVSTGTCLTEAGIEPGTLASELSEERRSYLSLLRVLNSSTKSADKEQCRCCLLSMLPRRCGRVLGSEGLVLGSVGNHLEVSTGTCLTEAGIEPGTLASELSEERR